MSMTVKLRLVLLVMAAAPSGMLLAAEAKAAAGSASPRCSVWLREASFADSVARHDAVAFAAHLAKGAVFINGRPPHLQGEAEVRSLQATWKPECPLKD